MKIDHVGIAVRSLEAAIKAYEAIGLKVSSTDTVANEAVKVAFLPIGDTRLELLEPIAPESSIAQSIERRGEGVHHIALRVENIEESMRLAKEKGLQLVNETPRIGAHGRKIAFIHPKSTGGVLLELVQD